jgi:MFS family permease
MKIGTPTLIAGIAVTLAAVRADSMPGFFLGTAVAGAGFGGAFQGAVRSVVPLAAPHERAGVLSVLYVIAYLAMGVPAVLAGVGVVFGGGVVRTADEYGAAVMLLSGLAFAGSVRARLVGARQTQERGTFASVKASATEPAPTLEELRRFALRRGLFAPTTLERDLPRLRVLATDSGAHAIPACTDKQGA